MRVLGTEPDLSTAPTDVRIVTAALGGALVTALPGYAYLFGARTTNAWMSTCALELLLGAAGASIGLLVVHANGRRRPVQAIPIAVIGCVAGAIAWHGVSAPAEGVGGIAPMTAAIVSGPIGVAIETGLGLLAWWLALRLCGRSPYHWAPGTGLLYLANAILVHIALKATVGPFVLAILAAIAGGVVAMRLRALMPLAMFGLLALLATGLELTWHWAIRT